MLPVDWRFPFGGILETRRPGWRGRGQQWDCKGPIIRVDPELAVNKPVGLTPLGGAG